MKKAINILVGCLIVLVVGLQINYLIVGFPFKGLPTVEDVSSVEITYGPNTKIIDEAEDIHDAINAAKRLSYRLGKTPDSEAFVVMTFHLDNGSEVTVAANDTTVFINGKAYLAKGNRGKVFQNTTKTTFFKDSN